MIDTSIAGTLRSHVVPTPTTKADLSNRDDSEDRKLMGQVAMGDRAAFTTIYNRYSQRVGGYLWKMLRDRDLVDEALNDTMMVLWNKAADFDFRSRLSTWLLGIAHNKALKLLEKNRRHEHAELNDQISNSVSHNQTPENLATRADTMRILVRALDSLSVEHRTVMELTFYEGLSYSEIAQIVSCPVNTVKTRVFHARKQLTRHVAEMGLDVRSGEHINLS